MKDLFNFLFVDDMNFDNGLPKSTITLLNIHCLPDFWVNMLSIKIIGGIGEMPE